MRKSATLGFIALLIGFLASAEVLAEPIAVIVSPENSVENIPLGKLRQIFLGKPVTGPTGKYIPLNGKPKSEVRTAFDLSLLNMDPEAISRFWVDQRIRGAAKPPKSVSNQALILKVVSKLAGSISYVPQSEVSAGVKVIAIDGKRPGDPGYPLNIQ